MGYDASLQERLKEMDITLKKPLQKLGQLNYSGKENFRTMIATNVEQVC